MAQEAADTPRKLKLLGTIWRGLPWLAAGLVIALVAVWLVMPSLMLTTHPSRYGLDDTCQRLKAAIEAQGWRCPAIRNMNQSVSAEGLVLERQVRIVELCHAGYARDVLGTNPEMSTMMPCAFGVYEQDGRVYVTGMNTALMGRMFGGNVAAVMGGHVAIDEAKILQSIR